MPFGLAAPCSNETNEIWNGLSEIRLFWRCLCERRYDHGNTQTIVFFMDIYKILQAWFCTWRRTNCLWDASWQQFLVVAAASLRASAVPGLFVLCPICEWAAAIAVPVRMKRHANHYKTYQCYRVERQNITGLLWLLDPTYDLGKEWTIRSNWRGFETAVLANLFWTMITNQQRIISPSSVPTLAKSNASNGTKTKSQWGIRWQTNHC
jgi:hypothetical protein